MAGYISVSHPGQLFITESRRKTCALFLFLFNKQEATWDHSLIRLLCIYFCSFGKYVFGFCKYPQSFMVPYLGERLDLICT